MVQRRNAQTIAIDRNSTALINVSNPSQVSFMQIWAYSLAAAANCNVGFLNQPNAGQAAGIIGGYQTLVAGVPAVSPVGGQDVIFTVDPNANFVISNPNTASLSGWIRISS